jgi:hypothetical protein
MFYGFACPQTKGVARTPGGSGNDPPPTPMWVKHTSSGLAFGLPMWIAPARPVSPHRDGLCSIRHHIGDNSVVCKTSQTCETRADGGTRLFDSHVAEYSPKETAMSVKDKPGRNHKKAQRAMKRWCATLKVAQDLLVEIGKTAVKLAAVFTSFSAVIVAIASLVG